MENNLQFTAETVSKINEKFEQEVLSAIEPIAKRKAQEFVDDVIVQTFGWRGDFKEKLVNELRTRLMGENNISVESLLDAITKNINSAMKDETKKTVIDTVDTIAKEAVNVKVYDKMKLGAIIDYITMSFKTDFETKLDEVAENINIDKDCYGCEESEYDNVLSECLEDVNIVVKRGSLCYFKTIDVIINGASLPEDSEDEMTRQRARLFFMPEKNNDEQLLKMNHHPIENCEENQELERFLSRIKDRHINVDISDLSRVKDGKYSVKEFASILCGESKGKKGDQPWD